MSKVFILTITLFLFGCNTIVGSVKGVGRDMKAATIYTETHLLETLYQTKVTIN